MRKICYVIFLSVFMIMLIGCSQQLGGGSSDNSSSEIIIAGPDSYDSEDLCVITFVDTIDKTITFYNEYVEKNYTLNFDGASQFINKYGEALSVEQIREGDIVEITFLKSKKRLTTLQVTNSGFIYDNITKYSFDFPKRTITIGVDTYNLPKDVQVFSNSKQIEAEDILIGDTLTICGLGNDIKSIVVERGHGYLSLINHEQFIGGFLEIGQTQICKIAQDMMILVPEGTYNVRVSYRGGGGSMPIEIVRDEQIIMDLSDFSVPTTASGTVTFIKSPSDLNLYINGESLTGVSEITLPYGIYEILAIRDGYQATQSYLKVGQASTTIDIILEVEKSTTTDSNTESSTTSTVTVSEPSGTQVYLNGTLIGTAPVTFDKVAGSHTLTFSKVGYTTKSYTIEVDSEAKDVSYVFAELEVAE